MLFYVHALLCIKASHVHANRCALLHVCALLYGEILHTRANVHAPGHFCLVRYASVQVRVVWHIGALLHGETAPACRCACSGACVLPRARLHTGVQGGLTTVAGTNYMLQRETWDLHDFSYPNEKNGNTYIGGGSAGSKGGCGGEGGGEGGAEGLGDPQGWRRGLEGSRGVRRWGLGGCGSGALAAGYAAEVGSGVLQQEAVTVVAGAPRYQHTGAVYLLSASPQQTLQRSGLLQGRQVGSYFGSAVALTDLNNDG